MRFEPRAQAMEFGIVSKDAGNDMCSLHSSSAKSFHSPTLLRFGGWLILSTSKSTK